MNLERLDFDDEMGSFVTVLVKEMPYLTFFNLL